MAKTKFIQSGIPNHRLLKNLQLNDLYISNDGGDEGITINDAGLVTISGDLDIASNMTISDNEIDISSGDLTLDITGDIILSADGDQIKMDDGTTTRFTFNVDSTPSLDVTGIFTLAGSALVRVEGVGITLDSSADITIDAAGGCVNFDDAGVKFAEFDSSGGGALLLYDDADSGDYLRLKTQAEGRSFISTNDDSGANAAHLDIDVEGNCEIDAAGDITLDADGDNITMKAGSTGSGLDFIQSGTGDYTIKNLTSDKDIIFNVNDNTSDTEVMRLDGSASSLFMASGKKIEFGDAGEYISGDGTDLSIVSSGDITLDTGGGDLFVEASTTGPYLQWSAVSGTLKLHYVSDTDDFFQIQTVGHGVTTLSTENDGGGLATMTISPQDTLYLSPGNGYPVILSVVTKTASGTDDKTLSISETLNLSSGAGGSDVHYGIKYTQTQTDLTGWDNVYLMYLDGGSGKRFIIDSNGTLTLSNDRKVVFGDAGEYIAGDGTDLDIVSSGAVKFTAGSTSTFNNDISLASGKVIYFDSTDTKIGSNSDNPEDMVIEADQDILMSPDNALIVDAGAGIKLDSATGVFEMLGAGTTAKFADMYAGMILGYTALGIDSADASYTTTTSWAVIDSTAKVSFVAPPSGNVEIFASVYVDTNIGRILEFGLSDNATYSPIDFPNSNDVTNEHSVYRGDETDEEMVSHQWVVTGLTPGTSYEWWFAATSVPNAGAYTLKWGGNISAEYQPFTMKATALPATIYTG